MTQWPPLELEPKVNAHVEIKALRHDAGKTKDYMYEHGTPFRFIAVVQPLIQKAPLRHPLSVAIFHSSM